MGKEPIRLLSSGLSSLNTLDFHDLVRPLAAVVQLPLPVDMATRFLCGISSPRLVEYKAKQMTGFGRLEPYPYKIVERWVQLHEK